LVLELSRPSSTPLSAQCCYCSLSGSSGAVDILRAAVRAGVGAIGATVVIVWVLLGSLLGLTASKVVSTTGEGTVVDIMLGTGGAVMAGWMFAALGGGGATGFNIGTVQSAAIAAGGAIIFLTLYHVFLRRRML
jgi:uncharacterized membrane protein YeaQ/YmgE (transglycosylase-associated protein family)